ncbi:MAG: DUF1003 domain-containing protein [Hyphomicrobiaceae bacterium]
MSAPDDRQGAPYDDVGACAISGQRLPRSELVNLDAIRPNLARRILKEHPTLSPNAWVAHSAIARYRAQYVEELLEAELGELSELERKVAQSLATHETLTANTEEEYAEKRTFGEALADGLASFGGSWTFILSFGGVLAIWITINTAEGPNAFDVYPFILLNLVLSCLAALQAPVIMMSQKRQEAKDRLRSHNDYQVNLKAEFEIRSLHEKIDHLLNRQWQRLLDIQQLQLDIMQERRQ